MTDTLPGETPHISLVWPAGLVEHMCNALGLDRAVVRSAGRFMIRTQTSTYLVDLDNATTARFPGHRNPGGPPTADLRRDAEDLPLEGLVAAIGQPARLELNLVGDGTHTLRTTTVVLGIEPAPPVPPDGGGATGG